MWKNQLVKVKNSLLELRNNYIQLKDGALKDREINIKRETEQLFFKPMKEINERN